LKQSVTIIENASGEPIAAEMYDEVTLDDFLETQREWRPFVSKAAIALVRQGSTELIPQHLHWDWTSKAAQLDLLATSFIGLRIGTQLQGIMKLQLVGDFCRARLREQKGKLLVYVDYLEVAPWNLRPLMTSLGRDPRYNGIGSRLIRYAVERSVEEDFAGRIGLHSLPLSEPFYVGACGMTAVGRDPSKQNLLWCEYTPQQASDFITGVRS
jgi:hypothetical protein